MRVRLLFALLIGTLCGTAQPANNLPSADTIKGSDLILIYPNNASTLKLLPAQKLYNYARGNTGATGATGAAGATGSTGSKGATGSTGATGAIGFDTTKLVVLGHGLYLDSSFTIENLGLIGTGKHNLTIDTSTGAVNVGCVSLCTNDTSAKIATRSYVQGLIAGIPAGATGATGATGAIGITGPTGAVAMVKLTNVDTALYGGTEIWLYTNGVDTFCQGVGKFYVPYYNKSVAGYGIYSEDSTYTTGDTVIWGGKYWVSNDGVTDTATSDFNLNSHFTVVPFNSNAYRVVYNPIVYDRLNDMIIERYECGSGNKVITSQFINEYFVSFRGWENPIRAFQWGNEIDFNGGVAPRGLGDVLVNGALFNSINFTGAYGFNLKLSNKSVIRVAKFTGSSNINSCTLDNNSALINVSLSWASRLRNVTLLNNSVINGLTMDNMSVIEMCEFVNQSTLTDLVLSQQTITGWSTTYSSLDFMGSSAFGDAYGASASNNSIVYHIELEFDGSAGYGDTGALDMFNFSFEDGFFIDEVITNCEDLVYDPGAYITLGIATDDPDAALTSTTGLCSTLDGGITRPTTALTYATAPHNLVAAVGGATISEGICMFTVTLKRP